MAAVLKVAMLLLTVCCVAFGLLTTHATNEAVRDNPVSLEKVKRERPGLTHAEAMREVESQRIGTGLGAGCCFVSGIGLAGTVWCVGMIPLALMYLVFRPKTPTVVQVQPPPPSSKY